MINGSMTPACRSCAKRWRAEIDSGSEGNYIDRTISKSSTMMNKSIRTLVLLSLLMLLHSPARAQSHGSVDPQPATPGDPLSLFLVVNEIGCWNRVEDFSVQRSGNDVLLDYTVIPVPDAICGTPPPLFIDTDIGAFSPGEYRVVANGTSDGVALDQVVIPFGVGPGPATAIPVGGPLFACFMILVLALAAWRHRALPI